MTLSASAHWSWPPTMAKRNVFMLRELCSDVSNRIGYFIIDWENLEEVYSTTCDGQSKIRKRRRTARVDDDGGNEDDYNVDSINEDGNYDDEDIDDANKENEGDKG